MTFVCGFSFAKKDKQKPFIIFSSSPINMENFNNAQKYFPKGETIHYFIFVPKGFQDDFVRIQVLKKETKVDFGGYSVKYTTDAEVEPKTSRLTGEITLYESGTFVMQVVDFANPNEAISVGVFVVE